jgi:hypothetical protein
VPLSMESGSDRLGFQPSPGRSANAHSALMLVPRNLVHRELARLRNSDLATETDRAGPGRTLTRRSTRFTMPNRKSKENELTMQRIVSALTVATALCLAPAASAFPKVMPVSKGKAAIHRDARHVAAAVANDLGLWPARVRLRACGHYGHRAEVGCVVHWDYGSGTYDCVQPMIAYYSVGLHISLFDQSSQMQCYGSAGY